MEAQSLIRVLHITPVYPSEDFPGRGTFVKTQIDSLKKYAIIDILVLPGSQGIIPYIKSIPIILKSLRKNYHLIHVHYGNVSTLVKILNVGRKPIITSYFGSDLLGVYKTVHKQSSKSILFKYINRFFSRFDTYSIVKSENLKDKIKNISKKIAIIPNGVNIDFFKPEDKSVSRTKLALDLHQKIILFPADSNNAIKNFILLKNALNEIQNLEYKLITFEHKNVPYKDVPTYINSADLIVCTSLQEGSPNIIKESMACNATIYSTDCGDVKYLLENVNNAKILPFDSTMWANEIRSFLLQKSIPNSNSRKLLIDKKLDLNSVAENIYIIYQKCLKKI